MLWDDPRINQEPALSGGWYAAPPLLSWADFEARYLRAFGVKPPRLASRGSDATALAAVLGRRGSHDFSPGTLTNPSGFAGVDGLFRLLPNGMSERSYAIDEVVLNAPSQEIVPAPTTFSIPVN